MRAENEDSRHSLSLFAQAAFYTYVSNDGTPEDEEVKRLFTPNFTRLARFPDNSSYELTTATSKVRLHVYMMLNQSLDDTTFVVAVRGTDNLENWIANSQSELMLRHP